jgi:nucleotide-binding universal stress UspA family protein
MVKYIEHPIVDYTKEHQFNLVVIGFMGHSKIYDRVWGSASQNIACLVPCIVMVVRLVGKGGSQLLETCCFDICVRAI